MVKTIEVGQESFQELNRTIRESTDNDITLYGVNGQRYIGCGLKDKHIIVNGVPGNALGALMDGSVLEVRNNAQDATGDTMNDGKIFIDGNCGDAVGYAMRGGAIYIKGSAGYRAGIHMKAYKEKQPLLVIGERAGSFLGEYQAGGTIIVLGINQGGRPPVGYFCGTGMHGGVMYLCCDTLPVDLPAQVAAREAEEADKEKISLAIEPFCTAFSLDKEVLLQQHFFVLSPNSSTPYKQLYTYV